MSQSKSSATTGLQPPADGASALCIEMGPVDRRSFATDRIGRSSNPPRRPRYRIEAGQQVLTASTTHSNRFAPGNQDRRVSTIGGGATETPGSRDLLSHAPRGGRRTIPSGRVHPCWRRTADPAIHGFRSCGPEHEWNDKVDRRVAASRVRQSPRAAAVGRSEVIVRSRWCGHSDPPRM